MNYTRGPDFICINCCYIIYLETMFEQGGYIRRRVNTLLDTKLTSPG